MLWATRGFRSQRLAGNFVRDLRGGLHHARCDIEVVNGLGRARVLAYCERLQVWICGTTDSEILKF